MGSFYKAAGESQTVTAPADKSITVFWWKHNNTKGLANIDNAALYLWSRGNFVANKSKDTDTFESLTRSEKLKLIEDYLRNVYLDIAAQQHLEDAVEAARATAITENTTMFELTNGV